MENKNKIPKKRKNPLARSPCSLQYPYADIELFHSSSSRTYIRVYTEQQIEHPSIHTYIHTYTYEHILLEPDRCSNNSTKDNVYSCFITYFSRRVK